MLIISTQCFPPAMGGIETLVFHLANEIGKTRKDVVVYADTWRGKPGPWYDSQQVFQTIRTGGLKPLRRRLKAKRINLALKRQNHLRPVILADTWKSLEYLNTSQSATTVCLAHGSEFPRAPSVHKRERIATALAKADVIIANSSYTAEGLKTYTTNQHIKIVHPGIEPPVQDTHSIQAAQTHLDGTGPVLITIARLEKRKGHHLVLDVLPGLIKDYPNLVYVIVGDGPCRKALEAQVRQNGLQRHVRFVGTLTGAKKNAYLIASDIFIMPGIQAGNDIEGYGIAYIEAAYFGVPSIASNLGGAVDAVRHGETGLVCTPGDKSCLEDSMRKLIVDKKYSAQLGEEAKKNAYDSLWITRIQDYTKLLFMS